MCGVIGMLNKESQVDIVQIDRLVNLIKESSIRGVHSFGYFNFLENQCLKYHRIEEVIEDIILKKPEKLIFHNRYSTSGDWISHANNQPIFSDGVVCAFNGVISGGTKEEMETTFGITLETENDCEVWIKRPDLRTALLHSTSVSFAGIWSEKGEIYYARNSKRPLYYLEELGAKWLASTEDIFKRSGFEKKPIIVEPYEIRKLE